MRYQLLGRTGLRVSELCLGAMVFGDTRGSWGASRDEALGAMSMFADNGGNFIDTANNYAGGESERLVGEFIAPNRNEWVLATKPGPFDPVQGLEGRSEKARNYLREQYSQTPALSCQR